MTSLSGPYARAQNAMDDEDVIWVTRKDNAMIAKYSEAIRSVKQEFVIATASSSPPDKETLSAVRFALGQQRSSRVIRCPTTNWSIKDIMVYIDLIKAGNDIRFLDYDGLTFAVFDRKVTVLWLHPHPSTMTVWIRLPALAEVLMTHFEQIWQKSVPALPMLKMLHDKRREGLMVS